MRSPALFLAIAALGSTCRAAELPPPTVRVAATVTGSPATLRVAIGNDLTEAIYLPGCNAFAIEMESAGGWTVVHQLQCFWEGVAVEVPAGGTVELERALEGFEPGRYRIRVDYRLGCEPGKAMSQAGCGGGGGVTSDVVEIR